MKKLVAMLSTAVLAGTMFAGFAGAAELDQTSLTMTTTFSETESAGKVVTFFKNYLEENSNGAISLEVYYGGTFASSSEELLFISTGSVDMTVINQNNYTDVFPLINFPSQVYSETGFEDSIAIFDYMMKENEETAALIETQVNAQNIHMIGGVPAGTNCFVSKQECTTLEELTKLKLGAGINLSAFNDMGFGVVSVMPPEYYDSLSRGIIDVGYFPISVFVSMSVQEVAPYFVLDGSYTAGNFFSMNLDVWNSLSDETKAFFEEAMAATQEYAIELAYEQTAEATATIEAAGGSVITLSAEDQEIVKSALFATSITDARSYAETYGCVDEMETVLAAVAEYQGFELAE